MKIQEQCHSWQMDFVLNKPEKELDDITSTTYRLLLHTAGDVIGVLFSLAEKQPDMMPKVLTVVYALIIKFREELKFAVDATVTQFGLDSELEGPFTEEELFGRPLIDMLKSCAKTEEEVLLIEEYLNPEEDDDEEDDDEENGF